MSTNNNSVEERKALELFLDVYGADRTRWPARDRLRFAGIIGEDEEALRLVSEAAALDRLLDLSVPISDERERALRDRIMSAAVDAPAKPAHRQVMPAAFGRSEWPAAAVLAASLVVGVFLGSSGTLDTTMQEVGDVAGLTTTVIAEDSQLALLGDETALLTEEDLL